MELLENGLNDVRDSNICKEVYLGGGASWMIECMENKLLIFCITSKYGHSIIHEKHGVCKVGMLYVYIVEGFASWYD
jgi:hypothetical protein